MLFFQVLPLLVAAGTAFAAPAPAPTLAPLAARNDYDRDVAIPLQSYLLSRRQATNETDRSLGTALAEYREFLFATYLDVKNLSGNCTSKCVDWIDRVDQCTPPNTRDTDQTNAGICVCQAKVVDAMDTCGACYGDDETEFAQAVRGVCETELAWASTGDISSSGAHTTGLGGLGVNPTIWDTALTATPSSGGGGTSDASTVELTSTAGVAIVIGTLVATLF
ncbi:hypothetical protein JCM10212_006958 [Sporobolomyces blumeae]